MIIFKCAETQEELVQIIALQKQNLLTYLSDSEKLKEGFLTVHHTLELLTEMNKKVKHTIAKDKDKVVGYALSMHPDFANEVEVLIPMFNKIEKNLPKNKRYIIMGQVCVDKNYRGNGVFRKLYQTMQQNLKEDFDLIITEVDIKNTCSIQAHKAIGFKEFLQYHAYRQDWSLISLTTK